MPNVGRPSRDCHLCRQRRVKCDLGRPGCQRCVKYGKECPGYRDQQELVFRTVNPNPPAAKQKKQQQQRTKKQSTTNDVDRSSASRACSTESSSSSSSSDSGSGGENASPWALQVYDTASSEPTEYGDDPNDWAIAPSISQHWTAQSIPIVLTVYNSVEFLKDVLRENSFDGPLVWATHLFSRTYVTNLRQPTALSNESAAEASQEIGTYMGKTLSAVGTALKDREGAFRDDIIGAVWMLCNYEIIIGSIGRLESESPWHAHAAGLWSILKTRGKEALHTDRGRSIFWPTYSLVQLDAIIGNHECPPEGEEWLEVLRQYSSGFVGFHISIFLTKVSRYQTVATDIVLKRDWTAATAQYSALFSELTEAENDLGTFVSSLDRHSHHSDDYMLIMHLASVIKAYNILFLLTNLATHDPLSPTPLEVLYKRREYCLTRVRDSAWKILAATPDLIASLVRDKYNVFTALFNALKLVWPLTAVRLMPTTLPSQKARAAKSLLTIGRHLGVKQATRSYSMVDSIPIEARVPRPLPGQTQGDSQQKTDLCIGYMDGELREPRPEELIGDFAPQVLSSQEKLDFFMI